MAPTPIPLERLNEIVLTRGLPLELMTALQPHLSETRFAAGTTIVRAGEYLDGLYYIIDGEVDAHVPAALSPKGKPGAVAVAGVERDAAPGETIQLGRDDIFGEGGALTRYPVGVDVVVRRDATCLLIRSAGLWKMFDEPALASFKQRFDDRYRQRVLRAHLQRTDVFARASSATIDAAVAKAELVNFKPNKQVAVEGQPCEFFYLVRGGHLKLSVRSARAELAVTYLRSGDWMGEAAVLLNEAWPFTVTAIDHVELVRIKRADLQALFPQLPSDARLWDSMVSRLEQRGRVHQDPRLNRPFQFAVDTGLINGQSVLLIDLNACTRCDECVRACADAHQDTPRFVREGLKFQNFTVPTACYHCSDPVCMIGCPTGAISRPLGSKEVIVDAETCIGCGNCVSRCPWGNILTSTHQKTGGQSVQLATKCDLCAGRAEGPACVQMCPQGCATRVDFTDETAVEELFRR